MLQRKESKKNEMKKINWCHSSNGEDFNSDTFETREECIKDATENYGYTSFYIGHSIGYMPCIDIGVVLEQLNEESCEQCGEYADDYLYHVSDEDKNELSDQLNAVFQAWAKKTDNEPTFFAVYNIEKIEGKKNERNKVSHME